MSVTIRMTASSKSASLIRGFTFIVIWFQLMLTRLRLFSYRLSTGISTSITFCYPLPEKYIYALIIIY